MDKNKLDEIFDNLVSANHRKIERRLIKANAEIETIQREETAYYDGAWDAIKNVKDLMQADPAEEATT